MISCDIDSCEKWHSRLIHGAAVPGLVLSVCYPGSDVLLLIQEVDIPSKMDMQCTVMWDSGASVSLVTFDYAEKAALVGSCCEFEVTGILNQPIKYTTKLYKVPVMDRAGDEHIVFAYGIEKILVQPYVQVPRKILSMLESVHDELDENLVLHTGGNVDLLIGMSESPIQPVKLGSTGSLSLYESQFGDRFLVAGSMNTNRHGYSTAFLIKDNKMPEFLTAEGLGVEIPKRCKSCQCCKECNYKALHLSWKENEELKAIEDGLSYDMKKAKWIAKYPFKTDPSVLSDNRSQALSLMKGLEKRFADAVDRGVFRELEDPSSYQGPVNYISLVDTYKSGDQVTTPIRLCMNSSLKYAGKSLNDLMMKGPSALNDLYGVLIGFRCHIVAFVKDLSKFYQSVEACERDQHLRRIVWRYGKLEEECKTYITMVVNFGDRPAGGVAQVALRKLQVCSSSLTHMLQR